MADNFSWILPGEIGGTSLPGGWGYDPDGCQAQLREDLGWLSSQGVRALVSLTEKPLREEIVREQGMLYLHLPIEDMQPPRLEDIAVFIDFVREAQKAERPVAVHCRAGIGRTGTLLACYLVHRNCDPEEALAEIRRKRPGSIETIAQEAAVREYAAYLKSAAAWNNALSRN